MRSDDIVGMPSWPPALGALLNIYMIIGTVVGFGLLIYFGYAVKWYAPFTLIPGVFIFFGFIGLIERNTWLQRAPWVISLAGLIETPLALYGIYILIATYYKA